MLSLFRTLCVILYLCDIWSVDFGGLLAQPPELDWWPRPTPGLDPPAPTLLLQPIIVSHIVKLVSRLWYIRWVYASECGGTSPSPPLPSCTTLNAIRFGCVWILPRIEFTDRFEFTNGPEQGGLNNFRIQYPCLPLQFLIASPHRWLENNRRSQSTHCQVNRGRLVVWPSFEDILEAQRVEQWPQSV